MLYKQSETKSSLAEDLGSEKGKKTSRGLVSRAL